MSEVKQEKMKSYLQLAREAVREKDYDTATDHLISALQLDKNNSDAYGIMGDMALSKKDYDAAEGYYLRQLELDSQSYEAHKNLGRLYWERSEYESAINEFKTAMKQDKEHIQGDPYLYLASLYFSLGQYEESYEWLYRLSFEVQKQMPQSDMDFFNKAYYGISSTINDNQSINDLDSLIGQIETKYNVSITTQLVVNPDAPLMPFRKTGENSYEIDYDLDSNDKFYEVLTSLILLDNYLGRENFDFHHFLISTDKGREEFAAMTRNTMGAGSTLSMEDLLNYMLLDVQTTLIRMYTDEVIHNTPEYKKYHPIQWLGMGNAVGQSYDYIKKLERIHAPRLVIYTHKVLLYMKSGPLFDYFKASDKRVDFKSEFIEHKVGRAIYCDHVNMKDLDKRKDWNAFYKAFLNQVCPVLRYYAKLEKI
jgi:tetratricopeptide (TPR) repeat protein